MSAPKFHGYTADFGNATLFNEPFGKKVWVICFIDISEDTLSLLPKLNQLWDTAPTNLNVVSFASSSHFAKLKEWVKAKTLEIPIALLKNDSHLQDYAALGNLSTLPSYPYSYIVDSSGMLCYDGDLDSKSFDKSLRAALDASGVQSVSTSSHFPSLGGNGSQVESSAPKQSQLSSSPGAGQSLLDTPPPSTAAPVTESASASLEDSVSSLPDESSSSSSESSSSDSASSPKNLDSIPKASKSVGKDFLQRYGFSSATSRTSNNETPLFEAAKSGNVPVLKWLIERGAEVAAHTKDGQTVLHVAVATGNFDVVRYLISQGANVTAKTKAGVQPIHVAAAECEVAMLKLLVAHGADLHASEKAGNQCIHAAAIAGNLPVVKWIVSKVGIVIDVAGNDNKSPLHFAAQNGRVDVAAYLVRHGAKVNDFGSCVDAPIHVAALAGKTKMVEWLLTKGAKIDLKNKSPSADTALHHAVQNGSAETVQLLIEAGCDVKAFNNTHKTALDQVDKNAARIKRVFLRTSPKPALIQAISTGNTSSSQAASSSSSSFNSFDVPSGPTASDETARAFLKQWKFPDFETACQDGTRYPLHHAAALGDVPMMRWLLSKGAKYDRKAKYGLLPIHCASYCKDLSGLKLLLSLGAKFDVQDDLGRQPIHLGAEYAGTLKFLVSLGADPRSNTCREQPIHYAAEHGKVDAIAYLVEECGCDPMAKSTGGETPLHGASYLGELDGIKYLVSKGADPTAKDNQGSTPVNEAVLWGEMEVLQYYVSLGVTLDPMLLFSAVERGQVEMVKYLVKKGLSVKLTRPDGTTLMKATKDEQTKAVLKELGLK